MKVQNKKHISLSVDDIRNLLIKQLYHSQGIGGIYKIDFVIKQKCIPSVYPQDCNYQYELDGAEITVDLNEK